MGGRVRDQRETQDLNDLVEAIEQCRILLDRLDLLLPEQPGRGPDTGTIGRHAPSSSEPWSAEVATAYWEIHFGSRRLADLFRSSMDRPPYFWRHGENGLDLIASCAPVVPYGVLRDGRRRVQNWVARAQRIREIDEIETWVPVPRERGSQPPVCPYCGTLSLRLNRLRGEVRCFFPGCVDGDGNPTRAHMEYGQLSGEGMLVFGDDTTLTFRRA